VNLPKLLPYKPEDLAILEGLAKADGHNVIAPTWLVEKEKRIVGYIGSAPSVFVWMDSQLCSVRDSICVLDKIENIMLLQGHQVINVPCTDDSPYRKYLEKVGFFNLKAGTFLKNINP
jgi:hypothetical protein